MPVNATPFNWACASQVTLCRVAWDDAYKDVVSFESPEKRDEYFESLESESIKLENYTYLKPNEPINVDIPFNVAYTYNYLYVDNPKTDDPDDVTPPRFYYFIEGAAMLNPSTTALTLQLDVFQTYLWQFRLGNCFVERGHLAVAAMYNRIQSADYDNGATLRLFGTQAEGLDIGNEYTISNIEFFDLSKDGWRVIIQSNVDLAADWGSKSSPNLQTADGQMTDGLASGCNVYAIESWNYKAFMKKVRECPWISKGIVSLSAFPKAVLTDGPSVKLGGVDAFFLGTTPDEGDYFTSDRSLLEMLRLPLGEEYQYYYKLQCFPYSVVEIVNYQGNSLILKPELFATDKLTLRQMSCAAPPYQKMAFFPYKYGNRTEEGQGEYTFHTMDYEAEQYEEKTGVLDHGYWLDCALWFQNFPQMSIVNDEYVNYLATTVNRRQYSYDSAGWSQSKSLAGNQLTFDQAQMGLATNQANQDITNMATIANGALSAVGSLAGGNVLGAAMGAAGTGVNYLASNAKFANNQALQGQYADQNKAMSDWAAKGDYQNAIAGINATVQDAALTQPSQSGQMSGDGFSLSNGLMNVTIRYKTITTGMFSIIGNYFIRFGYAIREYLVPPTDFMAMQQFTYWKMQDTSIICSSADEGVKNAIRGIFEKGVTVWRSPELIGRTWGDTNKPIGGIYGFDRTVNDD